MITCWSSIAQCTIRSNVQLKALNRRCVSTSSNGKEATKESISRSPLQAPRGMHDIFGLEQRRRSHVIDICKRVASVYGFEEVNTPLVEEEALFSRTLGTDSDVVNKEMYTFPDRSQNMLSLRPEGTAGVVRAAINHRHAIGTRLFYCGPMFRYERPQKGRARQVC